MSTDLERLTRLETKLEDVQGDLKEVRSDVQGLKRFQQWAAGGLAVMGFILGSFRDAIMKKMGFG